MFRKVVLSRGATLPVSLAQAKRNLDVTHDTDDVLIAEQIAEAVSTIESRTNLFLYPATVRVVTDETASPLSLPLEPVRSITAISFAGSPLVGHQVLPGSPTSLLLPAALYGPAGSLIDATVEAGYLDGTCPKALTGAVHAVISILYDKPIGYDLDRAWDAVDRIIQPLRIPS